MFIPDRILIFVHRFRRIRISDPGLRIPYPKKTATKVSGEKKYFVLRLYFFCSLKYHKILNHFIFELLKEKIWANLQRIIELFTKKLSISSQKYRFGIWDPESGKNLFRNLDSESRIRGSKRQHCGSGSEPNPGFFMTDQAFRFSFRGKIM